MEHNFKQENENKEENNEEKSQNQSNDTGKKESKSFDQQQYFDFYIRLRKKIDKQIKDKYNSNTPLHRIINLLLVLPDLFHLNTKLLFDPNVKTEKKGAILGAILYVISPIDLIPDVLPVFGLLDDLVVVTLGLNSLLDDKDDDYIKVAINKYWAGEMSVFEVTHHIIDVLNHTVEFLPRRVMKIVKDLLRGK
jgi:uncharacterized membrane protein YkvA (DUF1232 family)